MRPGWEVALSYLGVTLDGKQPAFALIAGVSKYPKIGGELGDLWPARIDVQKMVAYLSREPESFNDIVVLLDDDVTEDNLRYFLTSYFPQRFAQKPNSRFLFSYSGHGATASNGRGYLLTSQAVDLVPQHNFDARISFTTLRAYFQEIVDNGHQVLALINACFGAEFHRNSFGFGPDGPPPLPTRNGAHVITGGASGELTWSDQLFGISEGRKGSLFFEAVFAALNGVADKLPEDGIVDVRELDTYLHNTISRFSDERQNPTGGDLIPTKSPGGFFFLDNYRQFTNNNADGLSSDWWSNISFGNDQNSSKEENKELYSDEDFITYWDNGKYD
ncbi:caspase family protein [Mesorhizobium sp.]|uniref:caspase family protein n=1 Tax=Mesorhizobium sp. TaxID=1871066 RepID=UPI00257F6644|nr:caspase family protein [Mesorhizobium sp.]